ncbi:hypothetical protein EVAR_36037_1 [Eumeta japonica]|uniref:Uncharacterized protein n=1 Tax=Eumeta variegata TaxID=151549 RepID=A0A4C1WQL3_EUMVA|nr:hypothetical protein EVAR_36037_1 [Eumeta japonica]
MKSSKFQIIGTTDNGQPTGRFGVLVRESDFPRTRLCPSGGWTRNARPPQKSLKHPLTIWSQLMSIINIIDTSELAILAKNSTRSAANPTENCYVWLSTPRSWRPSKINFKTRSNKTSPWPILGRSRGRVSFVVKILHSQTKTQLWFPGVALERLAAACPMCAQLRPAPPPVPLAPCPHPTSPFYRIIHLDFLCPINNKSHLIAVCAEPHRVKCIATSYTSSAGRRDRPRARSRRALCTRRTPPRGAPLRPTASRSASLAALYYRSATRPGPRAVRSSRRVIQRGAARAFS